AGDGGDAIGGAGLGIAGGAIGSRDADAAMDYAAIFGTDNLQIIEGIGPKIEKLLKEGNIGNWSALAAAAVPTIQGLLDAAGSRFRLADPKTWPDQAKLADEDKWDELINYQRFLDTGKDDKGDGDTPSKIETLLTKKLGFRNNPEDLKLVEGIGPKIEGLLKDAGINNWAELAATSVERIKEILAAAGGRYRLAKPDTWPEQARLASEGKWVQLKEYQDFLDGGNNPG
ncbi:MAG: helix-hairpin-helix domain-containing protein, partial [Bacteroidota bacterium]